MRACLSVKNGCSFTGGVLLSRRLSRLSEMRRSVLLLVAATTLLCLGMWFMVLSLRAQVPRPFSSNVRIAAYEHAAEYFNYIGELVEEWQESHGYLGAPLDVVFSESLSESSDVSRTLAVNAEHTVVAEGSSESIDAPHYHAQYNSRKYHVRLLSAKRIARRATALLDYSAANVVHVAESGLYPEVSLRHRYVASAIFGNAPLTLHTGTRKHDSLSTFVTAENPRRGPFLAKMPTTHINETGVWGREALRALYMETKVLIVVFEYFSHTSWNVFQFFKYNGVSVAHCVFQRDWFRHDDYSAKKSREDAQFFGSSVKVCLVYVGEYFRFHI